MRQAALTIVGLCASLLSWGCAPLVNAMAFFPERTPPGAREPLPDHVTEVYLSTADGERLQCFLVQRDSTLPLVIYFHGNAGNIYQRVPELLQVSQCGVNVLGVGYRGYGKSTGRPSERGIYRDGQAAYAYATSHLGYADGSLYLFGRSLGTTVAVRTAGDRDLAGLVLVTPLSSGRDHARAHGLGAIAFLAGNAFDNIGAASHLRCPTLVVHGTNDEVVPYRLGRRLYDALPGAKTLVEIPGGYHNTLEYDSAELYWGAVCAFLARQAAATPRAPGPSE